jgi:hypothetical protein
MDDDIAMEEVVESLDVTFVAGSQPADDQGRSLLHASIVSRSGAIVELRRASVGSRTVRLPTRFAPPRQRYAAGGPAARSTAFVVV